MLMVTNRHGTALESNEREREREKKKKTKNKCLHLLVLSPGLRIQPVSVKGGNKPPKINRWSPTQSIIIISPTKKKILQEKKKGGKCMCVCRPSRCVCICVCVYVQGTAKVSQIEARHSPRCGIGAQGNATRQRASTAQSLIRTTPCTKGGNVRGQCLGILL